jgi:hypothetical protein
LHHGATRLLFLWIYTGRSAEAEASNDRRQRKPLQDKSHENHGERKEDDEVALREGRAVLHGEGQGNGGGKSDYAAHSGPAHDEDRLRAWEGFGLVKQAPAN